MTNKPICSIIILSYNQIDYTSMCLNSIREYTTDVEYEIIVIDNNSTFETVEYLKKQKDIVLICNHENKGFAGGCNQGIEISKGKYIVLLNNDTIVTHKWLSNMLKMFDEYTDLSLIGPLTNSTVGKQMISVSYGTEINMMQKFAFELAEKNVKPWRALRLVAFCIVVKRDIFDEIGKFDTRFAIGNYEDDDFNIRCLLAGKKMAVCRDSFIHHFMNISFKNNDLPREKIMFLNKSKLEEKWNYLNWNYYSSFNATMLKRIISINPKKVLHVGCGVGALGIEIKENNPECAVYGVETHPIRKKIVSNFYDEIYSYNNENRLSDYFKHSNFDIVIIENFIELYGLEVLEDLKEITHQNSRIFLRVFNNKHITSIEKQVFGNVEGDLICASSDIWRYRYDDNDIEDYLKSLGYVVKDKTIVEKNFSSRQEQLYKEVLQSNSVNELSKIKAYNYIFEIDV